MSKDPSIAAMQELFAAGADSPAPATSSHVHESDEEEDLLAPKKPAGAQACRPFTLAVQLCINTSIGCYLHMKSACLWTAMVS